jgi:hypothetical protein
MAREVNNTQPYQDKIVKLIPTETFLAYMVLNGIIPADNAKIGILVVSIILLVLTPLYLWRISRVTNGAQLVVTAFSFVVWVYALGNGPFTAWGIYQPYIASIVLILWTLIIPVIVNPKDQDNPVISPANTTSK